MKRRLTCGVVAAAVTLVAASVPATAVTTQGSGEAVPGAKAARPDPTFGPSARSAALVTAQTRAGAVARSLGLSRAESLVVADVERDTDGAEHVRYARTYAGLPVIGGDLVVHTAGDGSTTGVDATAEEPLQGLPTKPAISADAASRALTARPGHARDTVRAATLVVWAVRSAPRLAWQLQVRRGDRADGPGRRVVYVDAATGRYVAGWSELESVQGTGHSLYAGTVTVQTVRSNGKYVLRDSKRGNGVTVDVGNRWDPGWGYLTGTVFRDGDNVWGNGTASNRQSAAVDAAYGMAKTWDFYKNTFDRAGIRGDGVGARSRVHYGDGLDNAFWDDSCLCMTYGDGGADFKPLVSLDVAGHEMTHGVTSQTAGLLYFGESGGLNEATSDIFGTMVEFSAGNAKDPGDYYIGEDIVRRSFGAPALRRMDEPSSDGYSYDCWSRGMGTDDVHFTSGVANHFFYLLSEGTGAKTIGGLPHDGTTCNGTTFGGIGRDAAAAIWWRALTIYLTSVSGYVDARDATIRAALDLYPGSPDRCAAVVAAWDAVAVPEGSWSCDGQRDEGPNSLTNPGFESGSAGWTVGGSEVVTDSPSLGVPAHGSWYANFNGRGVSNTSTLTRTVTVPDSATATLRFSLLVYSEDSPYVENDTFDVLVDGAPVGAAGHWSNRSADDTYSRWAVPMDAYAGQSVTLRLKGVENGTRLTQFLVDDVSLTPR